MLRWSKYIFVFFAFLLSFLSFSQTKEELKKQKSSIEKEILKEKFNISTFREIETAMLQELKTKHRILYNRLSHVMDENCRVQKMKDPLERGMAEKIGILLKESHESLKSMYQVSCEQIDFIIDLSETIAGWYGGRIIGGGFGGCSIHLIADNILETYNN